MITIRLSVLTIFFGLTLCSVQKICCSESGKTENSSIEYKFKRYDNLNKVQVSCEIPGGPESIYKTEEQLFLEKDLITKQYTLWSIGHTWPCVMEIEEHSERQKMTEALDDHFPEQ